MNHLRPQLLLFVFVLSLSACQEKKSASMAVTAVPSSLPGERYGELFEAVQTSNIFPDSKTFLDVSPKYSDEEILNDYKSQKDHPDFDLAQFVKAHFKMPPNHAGSFKSDTSRTIQEHINALWPVLTRTADTATDRSTLIPLPYPYVVSSGRSGEIYYWDSYFTMLGLQAAGKVEMIQNMVDNFAYMIDKTGHIPSGNRLYFTSRSQPPFFAEMVSLLAGIKGSDIYLKYLPQLKKEYEFWMAGEEKLSSEMRSNKRAVLLNDNHVLNRYWDSTGKPRQEHYRQDLEIARKSNRPHEEIWRELRATAGSGWEYSSRWLADSMNLSTIHTTDIIPVELNALLYNLEKIITKAEQMAGNAPRAAAMQTRAEQRKTALNNYCWNQEAGAYFDYNFKNEEQSGIFSLAMAFPLFFEMATQAQADTVARIIQQYLLRPGGVVTTNINSGEQWDAPYGWAPLQWITVRGLRNYNQNALADTISQRWIALNKKVYKNTGKIVEKYNVEDVTLEAGGGEYPDQDGFGWTNGVLLKLCEE